MFQEPMQELQNLTFIPSPAALSYLVPSSSGMSSTRLFPDQDRLNKRSNHRRNDSDELDVFEAARYFSGGTDQSSTINGAIFYQKTTNVPRQTPYAGARRMSLDMSTKIMNQLSARSPRLEKQTKEKKIKQPISPGARLASFLNSLFSQTSSKKKKSSKSSSTQSMKDDEENGRRKRRSSMSNFHSFHTKSTHETKSSSVFYYSSASSVSGFRTPPPFISTDTPTKVYRDLKKEVDHNRRQVIPLSNVKIQDGFEKDKEVIEKDRIWVSSLPENKKHNVASKRVDYVEVDEGAESDSSSDLFELSNYDVETIYSCDLPVYETTHVESCIRRGEPMILNGPL